MVPHAPSAAEPRAPVAPAPARALPDDPVIAEVTRIASKAHTDLMRGDIARYRRSIEMTDDFVLMAPFGGPPTREPIRTDERWAQLGRFFRGGRDSTFELVRAYRSGDLIVLAAIERTVAEVGGLPEQPWALRVTLVFRHDGDRWLLAHRHADPLVAGVSVERSAALAGASPAR